MPTKIFLDPWLPSDINFGLLYARGHRFLNGHLTRCIVPSLCAVVVFFCVAETSDIKCYDVVYYM